jgi:hypothetical protein
MAIALHAAVIAHRRAASPGDFDVSREFGRRLLAGEPLYAGGLHYPYMPSAALWFSPFAGLDADLGIAIRYALAIASLALTLALLYHLLPARLRRDPRRARHAVIVALVLSAHYLIRDLDDGGPHLILLALIVAGVYALQRGRDLVAGACLGLAAALKAPALGTGTRVDPPTRLGRNRVRLTARHAESRRGRERGPGTEPIAARRPGALGRPSACRHHAVRRAGAGRGVARAPALARAGRPRPDARS